MEKKPGQPQHQSPQHDDKKQPGHGGTAGRPGQENQKGDNYEKKPSYK